MTSRASCSFPLQVEDFSQLTSLLPIINDLKAAFIFHALKENNSMISGTFKSSCESHQLPIMWFWIILCTLSHEPYLFFSLFHIIFRAFHFTKYSRGRMRLFFPECLAQLQVKEDSLAPNDIGISASGSGESTVCSNAYLIAFAWLTWRHIWILGAAPSKVKPLDRMVRYIVCTP